MSAAAKTQDAVEVLPEQQLLGLMLADRKACDQALAMCPAALMRDQFHRRVFDAIRRTAEGGQICAPLQIRNALKSDPAWPMVGEDYLQTLKLAAPSARDVPGLVDRLRNDFCGDARTAYELKSAEALGQVSPPDYLIKGVMSPGEWSVIYGEPGCGKSFLASWMAYSVSIGHPVFGRRVRPAPVVFAALEGQLGFERRLHALKDQFGPSQDFHWISQSVDLYSGQGDIEGLIDAVLRVDARLLVIDTLARAMALITKCRSFGASTPASPGRSFSLTWSGRRLSATTTYDAGTRTRPVVLGGTRRGSCGSRLCRARSPGRPFRYSCQLGPVGRTMHRR